MKFSKVIVLILSYNGKHLLEDSILSYLANDYPNFELVVIDNGSNDGTKEWVEKNYPKAIVLRTGINWESNNDCLLHVTFFEPI